MVKPEWVVFAPKLRDDACKETSERTEAYNCIAYAAGDMAQWWEPYVIPPPPGIYWPPEATPDNTLEAWAEAYGTRGFVVCPDEALEEDVVKIAIYADEHDVPQHAARQLRNGHWTSKLGDLEDIEHVTLDALEEGDYGRVKMFLKRPRRPDDP